MKKEKRGHPRFELAQLIKLEFDRESFLSAEGINISEGGVQAKTNVPLPPLTQLYLLLKVPCRGKEYEVKAEGNVTYCNRKKGCAEIGINFTDIANSDRKKIHDYIMEIKAG